MSKPNRTQTAPASAKKTANQPAVMQVRPQPLTPPVYRPQPTPRVLQTKTAGNHQAEKTQLKSVPTAPPVYRPLPLPKVLQEKSPVAPPPRMPNQQGATTTHKPNSAQQLLRASQPKMTATDAGKPRGTLPTVCPTPKPPRPPQVQPRQAASQTLQPMLPRLRSNNTPPSAASTQRLNVPRSPIITPERSGRLVIQAAQPVTPVGNRSNTIPGVTARRPSVIQQKGGGAGRHNQKLYEKYFSEAMLKILREANFGYAAESERAVIERNWNTEPDPEDSDYELLVLKPGIKPSDAVTLLFNNLQDWAMDCAESIQAARWHAELQVIGDEAFDQKYGGSRFVLKQHDSTGSAAAVLYERVDNTGRYSIIETFKIRNDKHDRYDAVSRDEDELLRRAPVGSRVMWRDFNPRVGDDNDYKNENTVKLGNNYYAAHPLGHGSKETIRLLYATYQVAAADENSTFWSMPGEIRDEPRRKYTANDAEVRRYADRYIRVVEIEYIRPNISSPGQRQPRFREHPRRGNRRR